MNEKIITLKHFKSLTDYFKGKLSEKADRTEIAASSPHRFYETNVTLKGSSNGLIVGLNILADIYEIEVNGKKRRVADGRILITSFDVLKNYQRTTDALSNPQCSAGGRKYRILFPLMVGTSGVCVFKVNFSNLIDGEIPFQVTSAEFSSTCTFESSTAVDSMFPFRHESDPY